MNKPANTFPRGFDELALSAAAFKQIKELLQVKAGIRLEENAQSLIISRLTKHLRRLGHTGFEQYLEHVCSSSGASELEQMINALTTNTTRFFREPGHFQLLEESVMPALIPFAKQGGRVRLWSAACSSGEEAYTIAAVVLKCFPEAASHDIRLLATDIDSNVLKKAQEGVYPARARQDVPTAYRDLMFEETADPEQIAIRMPLRDLTTFRYLNFMETWPISGPFHVVFCRNVAIYMDAETQHRIWSGLESVLDPAGTLFIGHSERIGASFADRLELFGPTSFRRPANFIRTISAHKEN